MGKRLCIYVFGVLLLDFYNEILDFQINFLPLKFLVLAAAILCTALAAYVVGSGAESF